MQDWCQERELSPYDPDEHFGFLRNLVVREGRGAPARRWSAWSRRSNEPEPGGFDTAGFVEALQELDPAAELASSGARSDSPGNWSHDAKRQDARRQADYIEDEILGLRFRISPDAFFQTNSAQTEKLYETAIEFADLTGRETGLRPLLRLRHDRHLAGRARQARLGHRDRRRRRRGRGASTPTSTASPTPTSSPATCASRCRS